MDVKIGSRSTVDYEYAVQGQTRLQNTERVNQESQLLEMSNEKEDEDTQGLLETTQEMTEWIQTLNTDIHFVLHQGTKQLIVQVVDIKDQRVLKEFPPHEFLDTVAKIREYVGILLDRKI